MGRDDTPFWDQRPAHPVSITGAFKISTTEITLEQYHCFDPAWKSADEGGYVCGVSWHQANAFCSWLGDHTGEFCRLPTEAEWEYARLVGDAHGVRNLSTGVREWCFDWYGDYGPGPQKDPTGPDGGLCRVVRGGVLDLLDGKFECVPRDAYDQPTYRAGLPPEFGFRENFAGADSDSDRPGKHQIGFRVVQGSPVETAPYVRDIPFVQQGIKQTRTNVTRGPDSSVPYFRKRFLLPTPPETALDREAVIEYQKRIDAVGLDPAFRGHNHSPALEVCDNGDLLLVIFTSYTEYEPEMSLMASRLRFGADTWDMPSRLIDCPGVCDNTPLLFNDSGSLHLFWAWSRAAGGYPFQWITSGDCGATWSEARFPVFPGVIGPHNRQPINRAFRGKDGVIYLPSDAIGGSSVLWASKDNMATWYDTGGRSPGRHTAYCALNDGSILALGGKNTDIEGYMPQALSSDGGATWNSGKSPFPALAANQRPSLLRLQSGRLFFASDYQKRDGARPQGTVESGSFVALSEDEGKTWTFKKLAGAQAHESGPEFFGNLPGATTLGYSVARQAPNGVIHLVTTMNKPCLHFEMNEAWIMKDSSAYEGEAEIGLRSGETVREVNEYVESYEDGTPRIVWNAGYGSDGRYLLHGTETWFFSDGSPQYEVHYVHGRKQGKETLWRRGGEKQWEWDHGDKGVSRWTQWWDNGKKKAESDWRNFQAFGMARTWDRNGRLVSEMDMSLP